MMTTVETGYDGTGKDDERLQYDHFTIVDVSPWYFGNWNCRESSKHNFIPNSTLINKKHVMLQTK